jgi:transposase
MSKLSQRNRTRSSHGELRPFDGMSKVHRSAAGVDIGAHAIMACVPDGDGHQIVRAFGTYTADLETLAEWFLARGIQTVAMESPGVSWMPLFETLEAHGLRSCLISASAMKHVPGRKSDGLDCQWIQTLHSYGWLAASLRPDADCVALRTLLRHRAQRIEHRSPHVLHRQQALLQMHIQLAPALSAVTGTTGQRIMRAMVAGERNPQHLAALRNDRWKKDADEIARALTGTWREEPVFVLTQALALCECYPAQRSACDAQIARVFSVIKPRVEPAPAACGPPASLPPRRKPHAHSKNAPQGNTRAHLLRITGVDLVAVHGMSDAMAQTILAEMGTDMRT